MPQNEHAQSRDDANTSSTTDAAAGKGQELVKATFYLTPAHVIALEELRLKLRKQGEKVDKSELVRRAIDLLVQQ